MYKIESHMPGDYMEEQIYKIIRIDEEDFEFARVDRKDRNRWCVSYWRQIPERQ